MNQRRYPRPVRRRTRKFTNWQGMSAYLKEHEGLFTFISVNIAAATLIITSISQVVQMRMMREERAANFEASNYEKRLESIQDYIQAISEFKQETACFRSELALYGDPETRDDTERRDCLRRISEKADVVEREAMKSFPLWSYKSRTTIAEFALKSRQIATCSARVHIAMLEDSYPLQASDQCGEAFQRQLIEVNKEAMRVSEVLEKDLAKTYPVSSSAD